MKKRTEVIIEIEREIIITKTGTRGAWCSICGKQVQMLTAREAAQLTKSSESVVYGLVESGQIHITASNKGMLLNCPTSLADLRADDHPMQQLLITDGPVLLD